MWDILYMSDKYDIVDKCAKFDMSDISAISAISAISTLSHDWN